MESDGKFIERLREELARDDLMESSRQRVLIDVRGYCDWHRGTYGEDLDPDDVRVSSMDLAEFRTHVLRTCQPNTVARKLGSIRKALSLLAPAVLAGLRMPKLPESPKPSPSGWTRKEWLAIYRAADRLSPRDRAIIYLCCGTGARASSMAAVKTENADLRPRSGSVTYDVVKGGPGRRYSVPLSAPVREALAAYLAVRKPTAHDFLFHSEKWPWGPITRWTVHDIVHRRLTKHLPREVAEKVKGPHGLGRHGLARLLIQQGVPLPDVAAILSHTSVATTANIYMRPSESDLRRHLDRAVGEEPEE